MPGFDNTVLQRIEQLEARVQQLEEMIQEMLYMKSRVTQPLSPDMLDG